jgi:hypothetical protein
VEEMAVQLPLTSSVDNKWAKGADLVLKPGDVVILKAETHKRKDNGGKPES